MGFQCPNNKSKYSSSCLSVCLKVQTKMYCIILVNTEVDIDPIENEENPSNIMKKRTISNFGSFFLV